MGLIPHRMRDDIDQNMAVTAALRDRAFAFKPTSTNDIGMYLYRAKCGTELAKRIHNTLIPPQLRLLWITRAQVNERLFTARWSDDFVAYDPANNIMWPWEDRTKFEVPGPSDDPLKFVFKGYETVFGPTVFTKPLSSSQKATVRAYLDKIIGDLHHQQDDYHLIDTMVVDPAATPVLDAAVADVEAVITIVQSLKSSV